MSTGLTQYAVYRLRRDRRETRSRRHQSFRYLYEHGLKVESDFYEQVYIAGFDPALTAVNLRRQLEKELPAGITGEALSVSDVLAVTREGITGAFYVDPDRLVPLPGFFHVASSVPAVTIDTTDFQIEGRPGNWLAADELWIDGHHFFLMQSMRFGNKAAYAVVDSRGRQAAEDTLQGFTDEVRRQLREYIRKEDEKHMEEAAAGQHTGQADRHEKENGGQTGKSRESPKEPTDAESAAEGGGTTAPSPAGISDKQTGKGSSSAGKSRTDIPGSGSTRRPDREKRRKKRRRKDGKLPIKGRESVLQRLWRYQRMLTGHKD